MKKKFLQNIKNHEKNNSYNETIESNQNIVNNNNYIDNSEFDNEFNKSLMFLNNLHKNNKNKKNKKTNKKKDDIIVNTKISNELRPNYTKKRVSFKINDEKLFNKKPTENNNTIDINKNINIIDNNNTNNDSNITINTDINDTDINDTINNNTINNDTINTDIYNDIYTDTNNNNINNTTNNDINNTMNNTITNTVNNDINNNINNDINKKNKYKKTKKNKYNLKKTTKTFKYRLGKYDKKICVLIKNRETIKKLNNEKTEMQKNLQEIKDFLCKKNLIKLGSNAPPDVLKKMYESCLLTGNLENTNTSNMLHNYLNL